MVETLNSSFWGRTMFGKLLGPGSANLVILRIFIHRTMTSPKQIGLLDVDKKQILETNLSLKPIKPI